MCTSIIVPEHPYQCISESFQEGPEAQAKECAQVLTQSLQLSRYCLSICENTTPADRRGMLIYIYIHTYTCVLFVVVFFICFKLTLQEF